MGERARVEKRGAPLSWRAENPEEVTRISAEIINGLLVGLGNNSYIVDLDANETSTNVLASRVTTQFFPLLSPVNAAAAAEFVLGTTWAEALDGSFTIHHPSAATARAYGVVLFG